MTSSRNAHVFLWAVPRSLSTAFTRSMESIDNVAIYYEPYGCADHYGPEGRLFSMDNSPAELEYTYDKVKASLEDKSLENKCVFVKDMGYAVHKRYDKIAKGYKHSFLIRHPIKSFLSYYNVMVSTGADDVDGDLSRWLPEGLGYQELWELYCYLENKNGKKPFVVNADDLLKNPKQVLQKYCEAVGFEYNDGLLSWDRKPSVEWNVAQSIWDIEPFYNWLSNSLTAGGFKKELSKPIPSIEELPKIVQEYVQISMPYYEKLNSCC
ncbi:uncharacterized protein [Antedon mediterranea]|uniref:uncharacterized protein n=1 Tax=Antedon mediterranea TaxID=105859 RepID=UPI003AF9934D